MNSYEARQEARKDRYLDRAIAADQEANSRWNSQANKTLDAMGGEPIKVGHHSERRHRKLFEKAHNDMAKASEAMAKATHYRNKAEGVGHGGISSDDPDAVKKLKEKLAALERKQEFGKGVNKIIRSKPRNEVTDEKVAKLMEAYDLTDATVRKLFEPVYGRVGIPSYSLANNNANIKRVKDRIDALDRVADKSGEEEMASGDRFGGWSMVKDWDENRLMFKSESKPPDEVRTLLKRHAFKWSRYWTAWVRKLTPNAVYSATGVIAGLKEKPGDDEA